MLADGKRTRSVRQEESVRSVLMWRILGPMKARCNYHNIISVIQPRTILDSRVLNGTILILSG